MKWLKAGANILQADTVAIFLLLLLNKYIKTERLENGFY